MKRARDLSPDHPTTHTTLGQTYLKLRDFKEARESFLESIQINPFNPEVHQGLATAYEMLGDQASALKEREHRQTPWPLSFFTTESQRTRRKD